jgi:hypothetical protein
MEVKRGQLLRVKAPPLFEKEYLYVVTGAGGKMIRADLRNSPKVKSSGLKKSLTSLSSTALSGW